MHTHLTLKFRDHTKSTLLRCKNPKNQRTSHLANKRATYNSAPQKLFAKIIPIHIYIFKNSFWHTNNKLVLKGLLLFCCCFILLLVFMLLLSPGSQFSELWKHAPIQFPFLTLGNGFCFESLGSFKFLEKVWKIV